MAVDMFIKFDGIDGEAQDKEHGKEIDVLAWSWGMSQSGTTHMGSGGGAGKANFQDISITKYIDKSSTELAMRVATGKHIPTAWLCVRKAGETPLEYIKIEMTDVMITSVQLGGSGGEDRLTENVMVNFGAFKYEYIEQKIDGSGEPAKEFGYDIAASVKK